MDPNIGAAHWTYLVGLVVIVATMGMKRNPILPALLATGAVTTVYTGSLVDGIGSVFNGTLAAATDLFSIVLIIALITAMLLTLRSMGADAMMIRPIARLMRGHYWAFLVLAVGTYGLSLFFWPTPAVPLIGAVLIPAAIAAGLRPMSAAMVIAIAGQGMALSSDYVIRVAPGLSATASGGDASEIAAKALVFSLIAGVTALVITYAMEKRHFVRMASDEQRDRALAEFIEVDDSPALVGSADEAAEVAVASHRGDRASVPSTSTAGGTRTLTPPRHRHASTMAVLTPAAFALLVGYMVLSKVSDRIPDLEGGQAAAMVGGIAATIALLGAVLKDPTKATEVVADSIQEGFGFAIKVMSIVFPIAGFFFLGNPAFSGQIMGQGPDATAPGFLFDLVQSAQSAVPESSILLVFGLLAAGMVGGLDGAGFSVLPLTGSLAGALGPASGTDVETLAAIGQMGAIWVGGGVLAAWSSVVAVAAFAKVDPIALTRRCLVPVLSGLALAAVAATFVA